MTRTMRSSFLLAVLLCLMPISTFAAESIIAVLENPMCKDAELRAIRPLFVKQGPEWIALTQANTLVEKRSVWTVLDDQEQKNIIPANAPNDSPADWTHPRDFLLTPDVASILPLSKNTTGDFYGWCEAPLNRPIPLVTVAQATIDRAWKKTKTGEKLNNKKLLQAIKDSYGSTKLCNTYRQDGGQPYVFQESDVVILDQYTNSTQGTLVSLTLKKEPSPCDPEYEDPEFPRWFLIGKKTQYLGRMNSLIEHADFDGDGSTEFLFWFTGYNKDGYIMFYNNFTQHVKFLWNYH